jgi:hypothetical protein
MPLQQDSPQSKIVSRIRTNHKLLEAAVQTQPDVKVLSPGLIITNGEALPNNQKAAFRQIQNCGTVAVKYLIDNENNCTEQNFHGILAGGNAVDDGLGSVANFNITSRRVSIYAVGGVAPRVVTFVGIV